LRSSRQRISQPGSVTWPVRVFLTALVTFSPRYFINATEISADFRDPFADILAGVCSNPVALQTLYSHKRFSTTSTRGTRKGVHMSQLQFGCSSDRRDFATASLRGPQGATHESATVESLN
jgi:hypothetical protein